jgi:hypothetical protein
VVVGMSANSLVSVMSRTLPCVHDCRVGLVP